MNSWSNDIGQGLNYYHEQTKAHIQMHKDIAQKEQTDVGPLSLKLVFLTGTDRSNVGEYLRSLL